jgi:hypothetical protein
MVRLDGALPLLSHTSYVWSYGALVRGQLNFPFTKPYVFYIYVLIAYQFMTNCITASVLTYLFVYLCDYGQQGKDWYDAGVNVHWRASYIVVFKECNQNGEGWELRAVCYATELRKISTNFWLQNRKARNHLRGLWWQEDIIQGLNFIWHFAATLSSDRTAWLQAAQRSPLFQCSLSWGSDVLFHCTAVNIWFLLTIFKADVGNTFFRLAYTRHLHQTRCLLNVVFLLVKLMALRNNCFFRQSSVRALLLHTLSFNMSHK